MRAQEASNSFICHMSVEVKALLFQLGTDFSPEKSFSLVAFFGAFSLYFRTYSYTGCSFQVILCAVSVRYFFFGFVAQTAQSVAVK